MEYRERIIHFDGVDGANNYDTAFANINTALGGVFANHNTHSFNTTIPVAVPIRNIKSIGLKSFEAPMFAPNIRKSNLTDQMIVTWTYGAFSNITTTISLPNINHSSISTLLSSINATLVTALSAYSGLYIIFSLYAEDPRLIQVQSNTTTLLTFTDNILMGNILGKHPQDVSYISSNDGLRYINFTNNWSLQPDNYYNLTFTNIQVAPTNANNKPSSFKIPINGSFGDIIYYDQIQGLEQTLYIDRADTVLDKLIVVITDRFGFPVFGVGSLMSFSLLIGYESI
jgi:hypothetical protein